MNMRHSKETLNGYINMIHWKGDINMIHSDETLNMIHEYDTLKWDINMTLNGNIKSILKNCTLNGDINMTH